MRDVKVDHIHQKPTIFEVLMSKIHIEFLKKLKKFKKNLKIWANGTKARHTSAKKIIQKSRKFDPGTDKTA